MIMVPHYLDEVEALADKNPLFGKRETTILWNTAGIFGSM